MSQTFIERRRETRPFPGRPEGSGAYTEHTFVREVTIGEWQEVDRDEARRILEATAVHTEVTQYPNVYYVPASDYREHRMNVSYHLTVHSMFDPECVYFDGGRVLPSWVRRLFGWNCDGCRARRTNPACICGHSRSEHAYVGIDGPCGARSDGCQKFTPASTTGSTE